MADIALDVAKLASMTVVELRHELEKRGLEKSGLKATLVKRLEQSASGSSSVVGDLKSVKEDDKSSLKKKPVETGITDVKVISETLCITKAAGTNFVSAKGDEACSSSVTVTAAVEGKQGTSDTSADVLERMDVQLSPEGSAEQAVKGDSKDLLKNLIVEVEPVQRAIEFIADEEKLPEVSQSVKTALLKNTECCSSSASVVVCNSQVLDATQLPFDNSESVLDKSEVDVVSRDVTLKYESESELAEANRSSSDATLPAVLHSLPVIEANGRQVPLPEAPSSNGIGDAVLNEAIEVECETSSVSVDLIETPKADLHTGGKISPMKSFPSEKGNPSIPDIDAEEKSLTKDKDSSEMQRVVSSSRRSGRGENRDRNVKDKNDRRHEEKTDLTKCLWVSGLSSITKAADLKNLFTPYGKVIGAKVVTSAKSPGAQCYGFVTMSGADEALKCIENLRKTTLHDKAIIVEKAKTDPTAPSKSKSSSSHKDSDKSKTIRSSSSRSYGSSSRSRHDRRQPERSSRRPQAATPDSQVSKLKIVAKPETIPVTETSQVSESKKAFVDEKISSAQSGTPVKARDSEKSFRKSDTTSEVNEIDSQSKDGAKKDVDANKKDRDRRESERSKDDAKSLEQLRIDRAAKIEKENKLREERRQKEREREKQLREERRKEQEKREKERRERARREAERVRKEREKQRELEKQKEREREKERERFARERKEREEREQKEREREREQLERARLERERLERERIERERAENERLERERRERDRLEKERLEREERELQLMREREKLELLRLDRERIERLERERVLRDERRIDRGISSGFLKRSAPNDRDERSYYLDEKRTARSPPRAREDFFASAGVQRDSRSAFDGNAYSQDELYAQVYPKSDVAYQVRSERRDERSSDRRDARSFDRREERSSEKRDERSSDKRESRHEERRSVASRDDSRSWLDERRESRSDYRVDHRSDELRDGRKDRSRHDRDYQRGRASPGDVRRVASEDRGRTVVTRDRSPIRSTSDRDRYSRHEDHYESRIRSSDMRERDWIDAPNASAPKTLSDVLGRAGLTGILGSQAEELAPRLVSASGYGSRDEDDGLRGSSSSGRRDLDDRYSRPLLSRDAPVNANVHEVELPGLKYELPTSVIGTVAPVTQAVTQFSVVSDRSRGLHNLTSDIAQRGLASLLPSRLVPLTAAFARPLQPVAQASPAAAAIQAGYAAAVRGLAIHHAAQAQLRNSRLDLSALRQARPGLQIPPRRF